MQEDRLSRVAAGCAFIAVSLLAALFALHRLFDLDVLWHLKTGGWILDAGRVPWTDPFGGITAGEPWLDVAWGGQIAAALIVRVLGLTGLQLLMVALVLGTLLLFARSAPRTPLVLVSTLLFVILCGQRFLVRPDLLAFPLTLLAVELLERIRLGSRPALAGVALLSAVWVNTHGSFILVPILIVAGALGSVRSPAPAAILRSYGAALGIFFLGSLVNPYTFRIYRLFTPYFRSLLASVGLLPSAEYLGVAEWTPTWRAAAFDPIFPTLAFLLFFLVLIVSFLRVAGSVPLSRVLGAVALAVLGLGAVRNLLPFGAAALAVIAFNERDRLRRDRGGVEGRGRFALGGRAAGIGIAAGVLAVAGTFCRAVLTDGYYVRRNLPIVTGIGVYPDLVPEGAIGWLAGHEPPGRLFNNYNSGAYLLYRLHPGVRPYIDARFDTSRRYQEVERLLGVEDAFDAWASREGIGTVVLFHPSPESFSLLPHLSQDPGWVMVFRDANSTVHVRAAMEARARARPIPLPPAVELAAEAINARLGRFKRASLPAAELTDAFISRILGDMEGEKEAYRRALTRSPRNPAALDYFATQDGPPVP